MPAYQQASTLVWCVTISFEQEDQIATLIPRLFTTEEKAIQALSDFKFELMNHHLKFYPELEIPDDLEEYFEEECPTQVKEKYKEERDIISELFELICESLNFKGTLHKLEIEE